jgi:hypothetical protein
MGQFLPGHKLAKGRPKGSKRAIGRELRDALSEILDECRYLDFEGKKAYLQELKDTEPGAFFRLVEKLTPPARPEDSDAIEAGEIHVQWLSDRIQEARKRIEAPRTWAYIPRGADAETGPAVTLDQEPADDAPEPLENKDETPDDDNGPRAPRWPGWTDDV